MTQDPQVQTSSFVDEFRDKVQSGDVNLLDVDIVLLEIMDRMARQMVVMDDRISRLEATIKDMWSIYKTENS